MESKLDILYRQQKRLCFWCAFEMLNPGEVDVGSNLYPTLDHLIPKSVGGGRGRNLVLSCRGCNELRGTYNTGLWNKQKHDLEAQIRANIRVIQNLKTLLEDERQQNKRLTDSLLKIVEDYKPWWKRKKGL